MQALAWFLERQGQLFKPYSGIDEIPEDGFAHGGVACKVGVERFCKQCSPKSRIPFHARCDGVSKLPGESHKSLRRKTSNNYVTTAVRWHTINLSGGGRPIIDKEAIYFEVGGRGSVGQACRGSI